MADRTPIVSRRGAPAEFAAGTAEGGCTGATYRDKVYGSYVSARQRPLAPADIAGLRPRAPYLKKLIREHFPADRNATVLDLGCGHGTVLYFLREAGYRNIVGVDRSAEQVEVARRLGVQDVEEADVIDYLRRLPPESQDVVVAFDVIEHFHKPELVLLTGEVKRVLRAGGRWILHVPNGESPLFGRIRYGDFTHEQAFTRESLTQALLASGFAQVRCFEDAPVAHGAKSVVRWLLWKFVRAALRLYVSVETGCCGKDCIFTQNLLAIAVR